MPDSYINIHDIYCHSIFYCCVQAKWSLIRVHLKDLITKTMSYWLYFYVLYQASNFIFFNLKGCHLEFNRYPVSFRKIFWQRNRTEGVQNVNEVPYCVHHRAKAMISQFRFTGSYLFQNSNSKSVSKPFHALCQWLFNHVDCVDGVMMTAFDKRWRSRPICSVKHVALNLFLVIYIFFV